MNQRHALAALAMAAVLCAPRAHATDISLAADGQWQQFTVDSFLAQPAGVNWIDFTDGSALNFNFTVASGHVAYLAVVDGGFGGDTFSVTNFGSVLGSTSAVPLASYDSAVNLGDDFGAALSDASFSKGFFTLDPGSYSISGLLEQSVLLDGEPLDSTVGALRLTMAPVPEPSTYVLLFAGLAAVGIVAQRRRAR